MWSSTANAARPAAETDDAGALNWPDFLIDLATLERTYSEVFDGLGTEGQNSLGPDDLAAISPEQWPQAKLVPVACLRLLELHFPVHKFASDVKHGREPAVPPPSSTFLVVSRRNYVVRPREVSRAEFQVLNELCDGRMVGEVITQANEICDLSIDELTKQLHDWFAMWTADGFFRQIHMSN